MDKSLSTFNIVNGIHLYETIKKDLHTLLVKEAERYLIMRVMLK